MNFIIVSIFAAAAAAAAINPLFKKWTCIGITKNIDFARPFSSNIGELPLVTWKNVATGELHTSINICKHMGSKLSNGIVTKCGGLQCQYHGLEYGAADAIGKTVEFQGKVFWTADTEPVRGPPAVPFYNNPEFRTAILEYTMDGSLYDSAYNSMDIRHPEFVHNRGLGFGSSVPPTGLRQFNPTADSVAMMFGYKSNRVVRGGTSGAGKENGGRSTENYHVFEFPTFTWSRVSFERKNHIIIAVHFCPVAPNKTKWYVTLCHNYQTSAMGHEFVKAMARIILAQDKQQLENQARENALKREILFEHKFPDEDVILWLRDMFLKAPYTYPTTECAAELWRAMPPKTM
jgi:phenylpropionate dioxygenase-like ring-hydroxylating dioxygenase large terminal subunit